MSIAWSFYLSSPIQKNIAKWVQAKGHSMSYFTISNCLVICIVSAWSLFSSSYYCWYFYLFSLGLKQGQEILSPLLNLGSGKDVFDFSSETAQLEVSLTCFMSIISKHLITICTHKRSKAEVHAAISGNRRKIIQFQSTNLFESFLKQWRWKTKSTAFYFHCVCLLSRRGVRKYQSNKFC